MTVARILLTQLNNIAAVFGVSVQGDILKARGDTESVFKEQSYESW
jgi:hypothetical protein